MIFAVFYQVDFCCPGFMRRLWALLTTAVAFHADRNLDDAPGCGNAAQEILGDALHTSM